MRNWKEFNSDEIYAIWKEYLRTEGFSGGDILQLARVISKPMRLTPLEIIRLVEELLDRLEIKEEEDDAQEMDTEYAHEKRCLTRRDGNP